MASGLMYYDGFEDTTSLSTWFVKTGSSQSISSLAARSGSAGLRYNGSSNSFVYVPHTTTSTIIAGCAMQYSAIPSPSKSTCIIQFRDGGTTQVVLRLSDAGKLILGRGASESTVLATSAATLLPNVWYYVELRAVIHSSAGAYELRINGVTDANMSATGQNTRGSTGDNVDRTASGVDGGGGTYTFDVDDLYIVNGAVSGAAFLGDIQVDSALVDADGTHTDFAIGGTTPAATRHESVDEATPDDDVTTVTSGTVGDKVSFGTSGVTATGAVLAVAVIHRSKKDDAGSRSLTPFLLHSGTEGAGSAVSQASSYLSQFQNFDDVPGGTGWTVAEVNATEPGVTVAA